MPNSDVWINGHHLNHRPNVYVSFRYDVTNTNGKVLATTESEIQVAGGDENKLTQKVNAPQARSASADITCPPHPSPPKHHARITSARSSMLHPAASPTPFSSIAPANSRFFACSLTTFSSTVPRVSKRYTVTGRVCPIR